MAGVFGAGVATAFQDHNFYPHIGAVYGASAGIMAGAYMLSGQGRLGSSIYWEDLTQKFISKKDFLIGTWQRFQDEFIKKVPNSKLRDALDFDYLIDDIFRRKKELDVNKIRYQDIPLYVKLYSLDRKEVIFVDARSKNEEEIYDLFRAGISPLPYVHRPSKIDGQLCVDAGMVEIIGISSLLERHPNQKIVVVLNRPSQTKLSLRIKNFVEGKFMSWMFNRQDLIQVYSEIENQFQRDLEIIKRHPNTILIAPTAELPVTPNTTAASKLKRAYRMGLAAGSRTLLSL